MKVFVSGIGTVRSLCLMGGKASSARHFLLFLFDAKRDAGDFFFAVTGHLSHGRHPDFTMESCIHVV